MRPHVLMLPLSLVSYGCTRTQVSSGTEAGALATSSVVAMPSTADASGTRGTNAAPTSTASPRAPSALPTTNGAVTTEGALALSPRQPMPPGPAGWRTEATLRAGFYPVLDGLCSDLAVTRLGSDIVVTYGGTASEMYLDGKRKGAASFLGIRGETALLLDMPKMSAPSGLVGTSLDTFWLGDDTASRSGSGRTLFRAADGTWKPQQSRMPDGTVREGSFDVDFHLWLDGGLIANKSMVGMDGALVVRGSNTAPPDALHDHFPLLTRLSAFPTGEVILVARVDQTGELLARHWAPGQKVTTRSLQKFFSAESYGPIFVEHAPNEVYGYDGRNVVRWDGTEWRALAKAKNEIKSLYRIAEDDLWSLTASGSLERITKTTAAPLATPESIVQVAGHDRGDIWAVTAKGNLLHREAEAWVSKPLPAPVHTSGNAALKAQTVTVMAVGDVLLTARYWEKAPGWKDQELRYVLFRSHAMPETFRCNEPDPENNRVEVGQGFQSWPPPASEPCTSPFVVLARRSRNRKDVDDWPSLRAAFKGHAALGESIELREFVSGNRTFVGAQAKDIATAKQLGMLAMKAGPLRPEIVCGDPAATRTLTVNTTSGAATIK
jgi:hypothetical protein